MEVFITGHNCNLANKFTKIEASVIQETKFTFGELFLERNSEFFPGRSDEKIMRDDVKSSIVAVNEMLLKFGNKQIEDNTDLFVANGVFIEDTSIHLDRILNVYNQIGNTSSEIEKIKKLYQAAPPLLALQTLTNSAMSFIAQYTNIKGNNSTFGNTSNSGYLAIHKGIQSLQFKENGRTVVCASNCAGVQSFLTFSSFYSNTDNWKESATSACLLFEKNNAGQSNLCRITKMKNHNSVVFLDQKEEEENYLKLLDGKLADYCIFSGAYTMFDYEKNKKYFQTLYKKSFSYFSEYGSFGSANVVMSVIKAIELIAQGIEQIDIFDRDPYGRICYLRVEK
jgi:hypothetical protein